MKQFVAISDDMFYQNPELFDRLVPFSHNIDCRHLLQEPFAQDYSDQQPEEQKASSQFECSEEEMSCQPH